MTSMNPILDDSEISESRRLNLEFESRRGARPAGESVVARSRHAPEPDRQDARFPTLTAMPDESTPEPAEDVVSRYFEAEASRDVEAMLSLFLGDAVVLDEGPRMARQRRDPPVATRPRGEVRVHDHGREHRRHRWHPLPSQGPHRRKLPRCHGTTHVGLRDGRRPPEPPRDRTALTAPRGEPGRAVLWCGRCDIARTRWRASTRPGSHRRSCRARAGSGASRPPRGASSTSRPDPSGTTCATSSAPPVESCSTSVAERSRCARSCPTGSRTSASTSPSRSSALATARSTRATSRGKIWPVDDASVDLAFATETLEHVDDPAQFLSEAYRVLRPGGRLILTVPFSARWHFVPYDYWRYTPAKSRLRSLARRPQQRRGVRARQRRDGRLLQKDMALILPLLLPRIGQARAPASAAGGGRLAASPAPARARGGRQRVAAQGDGGDDCLGLHGLRRAAGRLASARLLDDERGSSPRRRARPPPPRRAWRPSRARSRRGRARAGAARSARPGRGRSARARRPGARAPPRGPSTRTRRPAGAIRKRTTAARSRTGASDPGAGPSAASTAAALRSTPSAASAQLGVVAAAEARRDLHHARPAGREQRPACRSARAAMPSARQAASATATTSAIGWCDG